MDKKKDFIEAVILNNSDNFTWKSDHINQYLKYLKSQNEKSDIKLKSKDNPEELYKIIETYDSDLTILKHFHHEFEKFRSKTTEIYSITPNIISLFEKVNKNIKQDYNPFIDLKKKDDFYIVESKEEKNKISMLVAKNVNAPLKIKLTKGDLNLHELYDKLKEIAQEKNQKVNDLLSCEMTLFYRTRNISTVEIDKLKNSLSISVDTFKAQEEIITDIDQKITDVLYHVMTEGGIETIEISKSVREIKSNNILTIKAIDSFTEISDEDSIFIFNASTHRIMDTNLSIHSKVTEDYESITLPKLKKAIGIHYDKLGNLNKFYDENQSFLQENYPIQSKIHQLRADNTYQIDGDLIKGTYIKVRKRAEHETEFKESNGFMTDKFIDHYKIEFDIRTQRIVNKERDVSEEIFNEVIERIFNISKTN